MTYDRNVNAIMLQAERRWDYSRAALATVAWFVTGYQGRVGYYAKKA